MSPEKLRMLDWNSSRKPWNTPRTVTSTATPSMIPSAAVTRMMRRRK
jgi:hypothetical protein